MSSHRAWCVQNAAIHCTHVSGWNNDLQHEKVKKKKTEIHIGIPSWKYEQIQRVQTGNHKYVWHHSNMVVRNVNKELTFYQIVSLP